MSCKIMKSNRISIINQGVVVVGVVFYAADSAKAPHSMCNFD